MNLSVSHPLDSSPEKGSQEDSIKPGRFIKTKTQPLSLPPLIRGGGIERSEDDGEVVQSSTCVLRSL